MLPRQRFKERVAFNRTRIIPVFLLCFTLVTVGSLLHAQPDAHLTRAQVLEQAKANVEIYRKSDALIRFTDGSGRPVEGIQVNVEQQSQDFLFGAILFDLVWEREMDDEREALLKERTDIQLLWQCGSLYIDQYRDSSVAALGNVHLLPFIDRMDLAYAAADVIVSRAGAIAISELCLVGKPTVLIPSPNVAEDHQTKNAMALTERTAAVMVADREAGQWIIQKPLDILDQPDWAGQLSQHILAMAKPRAAEDIAREALALGKKA